MKRFACVCGNSLFFENSKCVNCKRDVGWCPACKSISALEPVKNGFGYTCLTPKCGQCLLKCENYFTHDVCNRCVAMPEPVPAASKPAAADAKPGNKPAAPPAAAPPAPPAPPVSPFCDYCRFNRTVPNLSVPGNKAKWARIERAKRRVLYDFDAAGLPYGTVADRVDPPLVFDFKADTSNAGNHYRDVAGDGEQVFTGHDHGVVTLNLREADPVAREQARVEFREAHRTLVGHFRHEMGHYVWDVAIKGKKEAEFAKLFGDPNLSYPDALSAYYQNGPKPDWPKSFVSAYATMHPWEDWAETFANYLDMMASLETAEANRLVAPLDRRTVEPLASVYAKLGIALNELNRGIGLLDFLPEVLVEPVRAKMAFVHSLTAYAAGRPARA